MFKNIWNDLKRKWKRNIYFKFTMLFLCLYFAGTMGIYVFERNNNNPSFSSFYESCWSTLVYILSGFDVDVPESLPGRLFSILILVASIGMLGLIISRLTTILLERKEIKMPRNIKKHIIICNWNEKGEKIVHELHSPLAAPDTGIIVLSRPKPSNEQELRLNYPKEYSNVEFREGTPISYDTLKSANVYQAKSVIVLADTDLKEPDANTGLITLAVNTLWKNRFNEEVEKIVASSNKTREDAVKDLEAGGEYKKPRIIAEVLDHMIMQHIKDGGADDVICAVDYAIGIIAQSAINERLSEVYHDLLTYEDGTNEIYIVDEPELCKWLDGKTFKDVSTFFINHRCNVNPAIPVGIRRGNEVMVNPRNDIKFTKSDALIVLAYDIPDLLKIIHLK